MADVTTAIYTRLQAVAAVTSLVSARVYPRIAPQNPTKPYVTFQKIGGEAPAPAMGASAGLRSQLVQFDAWAETYLGGHAVMEAVRGALERYSGTHGGVELHHIFVEREPTDDFEDEATPNLHHASMDFRVWYR